jgi:hypothetical protein
MVFVGFVLALIVCLNVYFLNDSVQRRMDYMYRRVQTILKKAQPHDLYVPTPVLPTPVLPTQETRSAVAVVEPTATPVPTSTPTLTPTPYMTPLPAAVQLGADGCHAPQGWNNCGPATLSMVLHCYGRTEDQYTVAAATKPDKNDKNVSPQEMVVYAYSLGDMFAVMGYATDVRVLKLLLSNDYPVIVETWFIPEPEDEMGHYRLLTGYDDAAQQFTTQDSYNGPNQLVSYDELDALWKVFNRVYVVVSEAGRAQELTLLLDNVTDAEAMYRNALSIALGEVAEDAEDRYAWFNIGSNYVGLGRHAEAANAYDRARTLNLPWRMLWYQFGPFEAYLRVGRYQDVIDLANANLRAAGNLEESYYYRALARRALGDEDGAREDLYKALKYHPHYAQAVEALTE